MSTLLRESLRRGSAASHAAIEARLPMGEMAHRSGFVRYLAMQRLAIATLAPLYAGRGPLKTAVATALQALDDDLLALNAPAGSSISAAPPTPRLRGPAETLGLDYVVGGGALGMRLIERVRIASPDGAMACAGAFTGGESLLPIWRAALVGMAAAPIDPTFMDAAIEAAQTTFRHFHAAIDAVDAQLVETAA